MNQPLKNVPAVQEIEPMQMLQLAVEKGASVEQLEKLMALEERWRAAKAKEAFVRAMTQFKADPARIIKSKTATISGKYSYNYAPLIAVVDAACEGLSKVGLSHRWETSQHERAITVTCILTHELGHSERTTLSAMPDESGGKNSIQAVGSTVSYLQRYTLLAATGLAAADMDTDGEVAAASDDDLMEHASKMSDIDTMPALAKYMNALSPAVQKAMLATFQKRRQELGNAK